MTKIKTTIGANRERAKAVFDLLDAEYPDAECSLDHSNALELMVATILSAQCTDKRVNIVTPALFAEYKTAFDYAESTQEKLEKFVQTCGFYRSKAKNIQSACRRIVMEHGGEVPRTLDELVKLAGVGRKTANVVLGTCFDTPGVVVQDNLDTNTYPMPIYAHNKDDVFVGRIRQDFSCTKSINLWIVADNLRKGAATNAIQIAEKVVKKFF